MNKDLANDCRKLFEWAKTPEQWEAGYRRLNEKYPNRGFDKELEKLIKKRQQPEIEKKREEVRVSPDLFGTEVKKEKKELYYNPKTGKEEEW